MMNKYIVIVESDETRSGNKEKSIMTEKGTKFIILYEAKGWVDATSRKYQGGFIPLDVKLFNTKNKAINFANKWKGYPWWVKPNGNYEIFEVEEIIETIHHITGYKIIKE